MTFDLTIMAGRNDHEGKAVSLLDTGVEDTFCLCSTKNNNLLSGHDSLLKLWSPKDGSLINQISTSVRGDVTCIVQSEKTFAASVDNTVLFYDWRDLVKPLHQFSFNREEINEICIHQNGNFLCACDDSGEIKVIDVENAKVFKTLSRCHTNICSTVKFNPRKPWELVSGGLDCKIVRWDFSRGRPISEVTIQAGGSQTGSYMVNPPMVHCIDILRNFSIVCGLGNGSVAVYALNGKGLQEKSSSALHSAGVAHVCCADLSSDDKTLVFSGGNDGKIFISELKQEHSAGADRAADVYKLKSVSRINHRSKVNWLTFQGSVSGSCEALSGCGRLFVADQTKFISVYDVL